MAERVGLARHGEWAPAREHVHEARRFVSDALVEWRLHPVAETATLLVSELATNAVLHAQTPFVVDVAWNGEVVFLQVTDGSAAMPVLNSSANGNCHGRGLLVVDALAQEWGATLLPAGKRVWATVR